MSREDAPEGGLKGRVTDALQTLECDFETTDFYVCGASTMVADCKALLESRGAQHLYTESF